MNMPKMESLTHLLIVDDDHEIRELLDRFLTKHGYRITTARDGKEMRRAVADWNIDLIILDLMLPGEDGLSLCRNLRAKSHVPIIMLTMMNEETDRIIGLEMGADDYLPKPFNPRELLARIKAVLRRANNPSNDKISFNRHILAFEGWKLDLGLRRLLSPQKLIVDLSSGEFDLLTAFIEHPMQVMSRDQLMDLTNRRTEIPFDRSVDMQVSRLRHKIEVNPKEPKLVKTVRGGGYVFTAKVTKDETADY